MASTPASDRSKGRKTVTGHDGFLRHAGFRWLKVALVVCLIYAAAVFRWV